MANSAFELIKANQGATLLAVNQTAHALSVGDWVYLNGGDYEKALADAEATSFVVGVVVDDIDINNFTLQMGGSVSILTGLVSGTVYYLSETVAGALTGTQPDTPNTVIPLVVANSTTSGVMLSLGEKGGGSSGGGVTFFHAQVNTFSAGDVVRLTAGGDYALAQADSAANAESIGVVSVATGTGLIVQQAGHITGLTGLTDEAVYFLDPITPGALTETQPTTIGQIVKPVLIADGTTSAWVVPYRGNDVEVAALPAPYDLAIVAGFTVSGGLEDIAVQDYGIFVMGRSGEFTGETGYIDTPSSGTDAIVDVEKNGTTIYVTPPAFSTGGNTLTPGVLKTDGTEDFIPGDRITVKVTQIGSVTAGQGLRLTVTGEV